MTQHVILHEVNDFYELENLLEEEITLNSYTVINISLDCYNGMYRVICVYGINEQLLQLYGLS